MDTLTSEILAAAVIVAAGVVVYFDTALASPTILLPSQAVTGEREPEAFITILELPPVTDAHAAVKVGVSCQIKQTRGK